MKRVVLQYGRTGLDVQIPGANVTVVEPRFVPGLPDEAAAFRDAMRTPIGRPPLREIVRATDRVAVLIPDHTRPLPRERLLPWLFAELDHVPAKNFVIINGTGSHRANTPAEFREMVGNAVFERYRVINHDSRDPMSLLRAGMTADGRPVWLNREYVRADRRIVLGFIEPHFMAGFSGGYKGVSVELDPAAFRVRVAGHFSIPVDRLLNEYGMTELSSPFYAWAGEPAHRGCPWTRIRVIDPETGAESAEGEAGYLEIVDLANLGSVAAIRTQDLAIARGDNAFTLLGRDPGALPRGCSRRADDLLTRP